MENQIRSLAESIGRELINTSIDLSQDYSEIGLEKLLDNEAFKEIPVIKTIFGLTKGTLAIRELIFARKLVVFLCQFQKGIHSQKDQQMYLYDLQANPKKRDKIIEQIIVMNERYVTLNKSAIHANLLIAHLMEKLTWDELSNLLVCLDLLPPKSLQRLVELPDINFKTKNRLEPFDTPFYAVGLAWIIANSWIITDLGKKLFYYGIRGDFDGTIPPENV